MKRRTKVVFLVGSLAVATVAATVVGLSVALARVVDPHGQCSTGFSMLIDCRYHWSSATTVQGSPIFTAPSSQTSTTPSIPIGTILSAAETSWALADCPQNYLAKRLLCPVASVAEAASDDLATGLPRPKPWVLTTARNSPFIKSVHIETPLDLAAVLAFYRVELSKRGWTENDGAAVEPDRAVIAFTTVNGPALLRLVHQDDRTIADLSLRKPAAFFGQADILPSPGQVKLMFGNTTDEEAVITVNQQTIKLAARAESRNSPQIDLPPGKYKVTLELARGAAQKREFEVAAGETWELLAGPAGVPLPLHLY
jgi:hypothetical protein